MPEIPFNLAMKINFPESDKKIHLKNIFIIEVKFCITSCLLIEDKEIYVAKCLVFSHERFYSLSPKTQIH